MPTTTTTTTTIVGGANCQYHGKVIGAFEDEQTAHDVAGEVFAVDDVTIRLIGFTYDGNGPDAFVWGGEAGDTPTSSGFIIGSQTKLGAYQNANIDLILPAGMSLSRLKWISIWCRDFAVNFGHVDIPANFNPPAEHDLGEMGPGPSVYGVYAESVVIVNAKQIRFVNLDYRGNGPDAFMWAGEGNEPDSSGFIVPDETGSSAILRGYSDATITITLPEGKTVFDIGHIGIWCRAFSADFGHIDIPAADTLNIPPTPLADVPPMLTTQQPPPV
ncbi:protein Skeletor, isoforms B/C-like [Diadema antillarum]|uniref:protein Skeletor, isoforms B/C-like n=1 Tax=Diadema antillarum TaxID=105358 RepID=UPI003A876620